MIDYEDCLHMACRPHPFIGRNPQPIVRFALSLREPPAPRKSHDTPRSPRNQGRHRQWRVQGHRCSHRPTPGRRRRSRGCQLRAQCRRRRRRGTPDHSGRRPCGGGKGRLGEAGRGAAAGPVGVGRVRPTRHPGEQRGRVCARCAGHAQRRKLRLALPVERARLAAADTSSGQGAAAGRDGHQHQLRPGKEPISIGARLLRDQRCSRRAHPFAWHGARPAGHPGRRHRAGFRQDQGNAVSAAGMDDFFASKTPLGRPGLPADIARAVAFAVGPDAAWVTGTTLDVAGGMVF